MKNGLKALAYLTVCTLVFTAGFASKDIRTGRNPDLSGLTKSPTAKAETLTPTQIFAREYDRILSRYSGADVDETRLSYAGYAGMVNALGDPHTIFMEPVLAQDFADSTQGLKSFGGVGARLAPDFLGVKVVQVFKQSPASAAGIKSGDLIIAVGGEVVKGLESDQIVEKIKGEIGTPVSITILRDGEKRINLTMKRAQIVPPSADGLVLAGSNIGYLLVTAFEEPTPRQFVEALRELNEKNIQGLVIDLRGNPGGLLSSAQRMLSNFVDYKPVVTVVSAGGKKKDVVYSQGGAMVNTGYPITVLINESSASAAEIFSGVMRDYSLATLVGEHSYGKASVQNVIPFEDGSSLKITIAHYKLPNGSDISRKEDPDGMYLSGGIKPDVPVELKLQPNVSLGDPVTDNQLRTAMGVITKKNPKARMK